MEPTTPLMIVPTKLVAAKPRIRNKNPPTQPPAIPKMIFTNSPAPTFITFPAMKPQIAPIIIVHKIPNIIVPLFPSNTIYNSYMVFDSYMLYDILTQI